MADFEHRIGETTVTVLGADGQPLADRDVTVAQTRHAFSFGNIGFDFVRLIGGPDDEESAGVEGFGGSTGLDLETLDSLFRNLFNTATLPFYWGRYEPVRGRPDPRLAATA